MNRGSPNPQFAHSAHRGINDPFAPLAGHVHPRRDMKLKIVTRGVAEEKHWRNTTAVAAMQTQRRAKRHE